MTSIFLDGYKYEIATYIIILLVDGWLLFNF